MIDYYKYYTRFFQKDLVNFMERVPYNPHRKFNEEIYNIQYFLLTSNYCFLDTVPKDRRSHFIVALFWVVLIDQVCYTHYHSVYPAFQNNTKYPKFIGNCPGTCQYNLHPRKIFNAVNYYSINTRGGIYNGFKLKQKRDRVHYYTTLEQSKPIMMQEIKKYFQNNQPEVGWKEFWERCQFEI